MSAESATGLTTQRREAKKNAKKLKISFPFFFFVDEMRKKMRKGVKMARNSVVWYVCGHMCGRVCE